MRGNNIYSIVGDTILFCTVVIATCTGKRYKRMHATQGIGTLVLYPVVLCLWK